MKRSSNIVIILIVIILIIIIILFFYRQTTYESFINSEESSKKVQTGLGPTDSTGSITFSKPFNTPPMVFTQIIGNSKNTSNVYSIQVFNVTTTGFNYLKNQVLSKPAANVSISVIDVSNKEPFYWMAILN